MRMKFNKLSRTAKAVVLSLAIGLGSTGCIRDYTSDYLYAVSNTNNGAISAYAVDYQTGVLTTLSGSPFTSNLTNPSTVVAAPNGKTIYVIGGSENAQVEVMSVGEDGTLYGAATPNLPGTATYPTAAATDTTGSYLYVAYEFESGYSAVSPGPGGVAIYPIQSNGTLGTPTTVNVGFTPVAIAVSAPTCTATPALPSSVSGLTSPNCVIYGSLSGTNNGYTNTFVYVVDQDQEPSGTPVPTILGFVQNASNGNLVPITGTNAKGGWGAGVLPTAIAIDPTGTFVYVTDALENEVYGYQISNGSSGVLTGMTSSPYPTGQYPVAITIEPRGKYVYVANYNSNTVSSYSLNLGNGALGATAGANFITETAPTCVTVDPALGLYLYTSNYLDSSVSGGRLNPDTGALSAVTSSFFPSVSQPICLIAVPNGAHASQETAP